ncbi:MAG: hypothetical protein RRE21_00570 [Desulfurococcales archaeon]|nr:hypothetical protein [Desulfurococcales archaeon]
MRSLRALSLVMLIVLAQALTMEPSEASENLNFNIESRSSLVVKGNWSTTLAGVVEVSKIVNVSDGRVEVKAGVYARLADRGRGLNFTLNMNYNTSTVLGKNVVESKTQFKVDYIDYGALARLAPTRQVALEADGSTSTTIAEGRLNTTLKATIKPSTGNRIYDAIVANLITYILNETLGNVKEELQKINATLEYKVTLAREGTVVEVEVKADIPLKEKPRVAEMKPPTGTFKIKISIVLERNQTTVYVELGTLTSGESLRKALNAIQSLTNIETYGLEETLDRVNRLLESLNSLITTLNNTLANINLQPGGVITTQETPVGSPIATIIEGTRTQWGESRGGTTLTLLLMGVVITATLIASYMVLTRRRT